MKNETNLLKMGVQTSAFLTSKRGVQLVFEHKLKPSISVLGKVFLQSDIIPNNTDFPSLLGILVESRWCHLINKKIKHGISGNNFHNNYLCFGVGKMLPRYYE